MALSIAAIPFVFVNLTFLGFYLSHLYGRYTKTFKWREYFAIIAVPILYVGLLSYLEGIIIVQYFVVAALTGTVFEYAFGMAYHKTLNKRLWVYKRFALHGYTSILAIPLWGIAGIYFLTLSRAFGL